MNKNENKLRKRCRLRNMINLKSERCASKYLDALNGDSKRDSHLF